MSRTSFNDFFYVIKVTNFNNALYDFYRYKDWTFEKVVAEGGPPNWTFLQCESVIDLCQDKIPQPEINFLERVGYVFKTFIVGSWEMGVNGI